MVAKDDEGRGRGGQVTGDEDEVEDEAAEFDFCSILDCMDGDCSSPRDCPRLNLDFATCARTYHSLPSSCVALDPTSDFNQTGSS